MSQAALHLKKTERAALWALLAGNFVIGTGVLIPAGMMNELAAGLAVSVPTAGALIWSGAITVGIGAPLLAALTSKVDRRRLLVAALLLYVVGHALSAMAPDFGLLLAVRVVTVIAAAVFTPQAAATLGVMLPPGRRAAGVTFIFLGWSAAAVAGIPLGSLIGAQLGWRAAFALLALLALAVACGVARTVPRGLRVAPLSPAAWQRVLTERTMILLLLVTAASLAGQFVLFSYIAPVLRASVNATPAIIAVALACNGIMGALGNMAAARLVGRFGAGRAALAALLSMTLGLALWPLGAGSLALTLLCMALWGLGTFAANSMQQARLIALAPPLASASVALNTSAVYVGQAAGAALGGALIAGGHPALLSWAGAALLLAAVLCSIAAERRA